MTFQFFYEFCLSLKGSEETYPFDHLIKDEKVIVFKVCGKMFALADVFTFDSITLKCDPDKALALRASYECVEPGFHMNKKHWITVLFDGSVSDAQIQEWIVDSYNAVVASLPRKKREALGVAK